MIGAALELISVLELRLAETFFWRTQCRMRIGYPRAPDSDTARADLADMIAALMAVGWAGDPLLHSHAAVLAKNDVHALLRPQAAGVATRSIELLGPRASAGPGSPDRHLIGCLETTAGAILAARQWPIESGRNHERHHRLPP